MITTILLHEIEYNWRDGSNGELCDSDIEHIKKCIEEEYNQGELCQLTLNENDRHGWWKIKN